MKTTSSSMLSSTRAGARHDSPEPRDTGVTNIDGPIECIPFRLALRYGLGAIWAQRRFAKEVIHARLSARLNVEVNRLALVAVAAKALDQRRVTEFVNELWLGLVSSLGRSVGATEAAMRTHIETVVFEAFEAVKRYDAATENGELPPAWRDRLVAREEARADQVITKLDRVLDDLIDQRVKLMTGGISLPNIGQGSN